MSNETESLPDSRQAGDDCPLPVSVQVRNIICYAVFWSIYYLSAPVSYVGLTHANLLKALGNTDTINNLPAAMYQWLAVLPVLMAWVFPQPRYLKPLALASMGVMAAMTAAVAVTLWSGASSAVSTWVVVAHGAVFGAANGVLITTLWDFLRRGVATKRRGPALGFTYSIGPLFACVGAVLQDALFQGRLLRGVSLGLQFPDNYMVMFGGVAPMLLAAMLLIAAFAIPAHSEATDDNRRLSRAVLADLFGEVVAGLRQFIYNKPVLMAVGLYIVVASGGNAIFSNVSLHAKDVLGETTETLGLQSFLRFGFKAVAGGLLGWLLARTSPRATLLATTSILLLGMGWALTSRGWWFMVTFGLLGAGELYGAYFPNYVTTASPKPVVRLNMAYLSVLGALIGFASLALGMISDVFGRMYGQTSGRVASFYVATALLVLALIAIGLVLPANPTPREE
jgi:hypothetical protein